MSSKGKARYSDKVPDVKVPDVKVPDVKSNIIDADKIMIDAGKIDTGSLFSLDGKTYRLINKTPDVVTVALQKVIHTQVSRNPDEFVEQLIGVEISTIHSNTKVERL